MLKQNQYGPLPMEKEVLIMFAAKEGYFDKLSIEQIRPFELGLYTNFDSRHADLLAEIRDTETRFPTIWRKRSRPDSTPTSNRSIAENKAAAPATAA